MWVRPEILIASSSGGISKSELGVFWYNIDILYSFQKTTNVKIPNYLCQILMIHELNQYKQLIAFLTSRKLINNLIKSFTA